MRRKKAVSLAKQGQWMQLEGLEKRKISWRESWEIQANNISFIIRAMYDVLPSPMNREQWYVTKTAFLHLRNIAKLQNMLSVSDAEKLVHAFMTSRLDYCSALLGGCPASSINKLQIVQNAAARVLTRSRKYDHITPILQSLHWLPIKFRISYKILLLAYKALND